MMTHHQLQPAPSRAALGEHPIHPMLVPFPIAFLSGALLSDIAYQRTNDPFWARASRTLLEAGLVSGVASATFGLWDFVSIPRARQGTTGWGHSLGNALALGLSLVNWRRRADDPRRGVGSTELALSAATAALLGVTGWLGGELSYRYQIGVMDQAPQNGQQPTRPIRQQPPLPAPRSPQYMRQPEPGPAGQPQLVP